MLSARSSTAHTSRRSGRPGAERFRRNTQGARRSRCRKHAVGRKRDVSKRGAGRVPPPSPPPPPPVWRRPHTAGLHSMPLAGSGTRGGAGGGAGGRRNGSRLARNTHTLWGHCVALLRRKRFTARSVCVWLTVLRVVGRDAPPDGRGGPRERLKTFRSSTKTLSRRTVYAFFRPLPRPTWGGTHVRCVARVRPSSRLARLQQRPGVSCAISGARLATRDTAASRARSGRVSKRAQT